MTRPSCRLALLSVLCLLAIVAAASAADTKPKVELAIAQPAAGQTLTGLAEIRADVTPPDVVPTDVYVGLGGAPYTRLARVKKTSQWAAMVDTTLVPNGDTQLIVLAATPAAKRVQQTANVKIDNPLRCYFGDLHSHTYYSDGTLTPADAYAYARKVAKLDFFTLCDHHELVDDREWADMREQAWKANEEGKFVALTGLEWTKKVGHCCVFDPPGRLWPMDLAGFYKAVADAGVIGQFNHPGEKYGDFNALAYSEVGDADMRLMEVRSEAEEGYFIRALNNGWHIAPSATDDTHSPNWGNAGRWTGLLAPGLSRLNVWTALKARHVYSSLDRNCRLDFRMNEAVMGDVIAKPVPSATAVVLLCDPDEKDPIAKAELFEDGKVVQSVLPNTGKCRWESAPLMKPGKHYYFVKVIQADGQKLWSAPIWVTITGA